MVRKTVSQKTDVESTSRRLLEQLPSFCLAALISLLVATLLIPSDAPAQFGTGAALAMLWVMLLLVWLAGGLASSSLAIRLGWTSAAVALLLFFILLSGIVMIAREQGDARAAINVMWRWISCGLVFFLARQLVRAEVQCRAVCAVMIALAVSMSVHGLVQYCYTMPLERQKYEDSTEVEKLRILQDLGLPHAPPGSPIRKQFESRLSSVEPRAMFALTNSLAGFLAPWLIAVVGIGLASWNYDRLPRRVLVGIGLSILLTAFCFLLTKSRTGYLAVGCGALMLALYFRFFGLRMGWKIPVFALGAVMLLAVAAVFVGGIDSQVISEALLSLTYRFEYWQSTWLMIADHPWLGCGPGNFQTNYTAYKLPQASEVIADPHNLLLEIWATAGISAAIAFVAVLACFAIQLRRCMWGDQQAVEKHKSHQKPIALDTSVWFIYGGAAAGIFMAYPCGMLVGFPFDFTVLSIGILAGAACVALLHPWVERGRLPIPILLISIVVLLLNLLASGGIGFPGVAQSLWLLLALSLNLAGDRSDCINVPRVGAVLLCVVALGMVFVCQTTMFVPVTLGRTALLDGRFLADRQQFREADEAFARFTNIDRYSPEPWRYRALNQMNWWTSQPSETQLQDFEESVQQRIRRQPKSSAAYFEIGNWYFSMFARSDDRAHLQKSIVAYERAVELYPNSNIRHAQFAWALHLAGDELAQLEARKALALDELNPHIEQKLENQRILTGSSGNQEENAELYMRRLRKTNR